MFFFLRFDVNSNIACMGIVKGRSYKGGMGGGLGRNKASNTIAGDET